ncbi:uncharacterized protein LOC135495788 [Lineus longissimus]|uniref:uncharacterized protein LOC135495788 n=1 Tax=Lineus longissimus TaxID=88925 RepID=UPI00315DF95F
MKTLKGLGVLWVLLACSFAQVSSDLEVSASNPKPILGTSVLLSCRIFKPNGYPVEWKLTNPEVGTVTIAATHMMTNCSNNGWHISDRIHYRWESCKKSVKDAPFQDFNITIIKTRRRDTGHWFCDEMNAPYRKSVYIEVAVPPGPPTVIGFGTVAMGLKHTLTCNATQPGLSAAITYQWFKEGNVDVFEGAALTFPNTSKADTGTYKCYATNIYGSTELSGRLEVNGQVASVKLSVSSTSLIEGRKVNMTCTAVGGNPIPMLTISISGNQWVNETGQTRELSMETVVKRDDKEAVCSANVTGIASVVTDQVSLDVKYPPDVIISTNPSTRIVTENMGDVHLRCESRGGNPSKPHNGTIAWYYGGKELVKKTASKLPYRLSRPNRTQAGDYRCLVSNYGEMFAWNSIQLDIIYSAEWDNSFPDRRTATAGVSKMVTFTLHILANPKPSKVAWLRETPGMIYDPTQSTPSLGYSYQTQVVNERTYTLNFWRVSSSDYGHYRAYVTNDAGTTSFVFTLLPPGPPYPPCCLKMTSSTSVSVTLTFRVNYTRDSSQLFEISYRNLDSKSSPWEKFHNISDAGSSATITKKISNLKPKTQYELRVRAFSHLGLSGYSGSALAMTRESPSPRPKVQARKVGHVAVISWDSWKGSHVEVVSCTAKGLCKTYSGTNLTTIGIPVEESIYNQTFVVRYYDGDDLAFTSKAVSVQKVPEPTTASEFPNYGYGISGFAGGCVLVTFIALIIWKVRAIRQSNASTDPEFVDEFDSDPYTCLRDGSVNDSIHTITGAGREPGLVFRNSAYDYEDPSTQNGNASRMNDYEPPDEIYVNLTPIEQKIRLQQNLAGASQRQNTNAYESPTGVRPNEVPWTTYQSLKGDRQDGRTPKATEDDVYVDCDPVADTYVYRP